MCKLRLRQQVACLGHSTVTHRGPIEGRDDPDIHLADNIALATEARDLMAEPPEPWAPLPTPRAERIAAWPVEIVYRRFCRRLAELWRGPMKVFP